MNNIIDIFERIRKLNPEDREMVKKLLTTTNFSGSANSASNDLKDFLTEERFSNGRVCPFCGCKHVVRNGHRKDKTQRYMCREYGKSFVITTNSITSSTRKDLLVWENYINCMMKGMSVRESAEACGIHRNTAFAWRHKILDALQQMAATVTLSGIIEADETFFDISFKGNHSKSRTFSMPRKARKRGHYCHIRGLSHDKVCVPCAVNRNGLSIAKVTNKGSARIKDLHYIYDGKIEKNSVLVTDKMRSYVSFARTTNLKLVQIKNRQTKNGIYHIQHVNNFHSQLKSFMAPFRGVATKYLNNYLIWNNFVNYSKGTRAEKWSVFRDFVLSAVITDRCRDLSLRPPLPLPLEM